MNPGRSLVAAALICAALLAFVPAAKAVVSQVQLGRGHVDMGGKIPFRIEVCVS